MIWGPSLMIWVLFAIFALPSLNAADAQTSDTTASETTVRRTVTRTVRRIEADGTETIISAPSTAGSTSGTTSVTRTYTAPSSSNVRQTTTGTTTRSYSSTSSQPYTSPARSYSSSNSNVATTTNRSYTRYSDTNAPSASRTTDYGTQQPGASSGTYATTTSARSVRTIDESELNTAPRPVEPAASDNRQMAISTTSGQRPTYSQSQPTTVSASPSTQRTDTAPSTATLSASQNVRSTSITPADPETNLATPVVASAPSGRASAPTAAAPPASRSNVLAPASYAVPDTEELHQIIWSTLLVINEAQVNQDYSRFMLILSPRMRSEVTPDILPAHFRSLEPHRAEMLAAVGQQAEFEIPPHLIADGRMRLRGSFRLQEGGVRFDLMYQKVNETWFVDAIAFAQLR